MTYDGIEEKICPKKFKQLMKFKMMIKLEFKVLPNDVLESKTFPFRSSYFVKQIWFVDESTNHLADFLEEQMKTNSYQF